MARYLCLMYFFIIIMAHFLPILPLTKKSKAIGFKLGFKSLKLNFEDQNELLRSA